MRKMLIAMFLLLVTVASVQAFTFPFDSQAWVDPNFNNSWNPATLSGTARYYFYFDNPAVKVTDLAVQFEGDIFDLSQLDSSDFTIIAPGSWDTFLYTESAGLKWGISEGGAVFANEDPLILDVTYSLLSASRYSYGNNTYAGETDEWSWNEAQGANAPWSNKYVLNGKIRIWNAQQQKWSWKDAASGGSVAPVPEPSSLMLLGTGLLGMVGYGKAKFRKKA